jgi:hypothetical protein
MQIGITGYIQYFFPRARVRVSVSVAYSTRLILLIGKVYMVLLLIHYCSTHSWISRFLFGLGQRTCFE